MAAQVDALILQVSADVRRIEKAMAAMADTTDRRTRQVEARFNKMNAHVKQSGDRMASDLRASIAAIGITAAIGEVTEYADTWTTAANKLAAAGVEQAKLAGTMQDIVNLSKETGSSFTATADLYAKVQRNADKLGLSQAEVLRITETVNKAFVAGGAAAGEQAAGILQLGQALGSGVLQGDELKSIRENAPLLAQAIADEFKTTLAGLKELGAQGELESTRVAQAILKATGIHDQFARTVRTVAQSVENLRTEFARYIAQSEVAQSTVQALAGFIQFATNNLDLLADAAIVAASVIGGALAAGAIIRFVGALNGMIATARTAKTAMEALRVSATFFTGPVGAAILGIGAALATLAFNASDAGDAMDVANSAIDRLGKAQADIKSDTDALTAAQERLTKAIEDGAEAATNAAIADVEAIRKRIQANAQLAISERVRLNQAKVAREQQFRENMRVTDEDRKGVNLPILGILADQTSPLEDLVRRMQQTFRASGMDGSIEGIRREIASRSNKGALDEQFRTFFWILERYDQYQADIKTINDALAAVGDIEALSASNNILSMPGEPKSSGGSGDSAAKNVKGYRTELEKLRDTLKTLRAESAADAGLLDQGVMAFDSLQVNGANLPDHLQKMAAAREQLEALQAGAAERSAERSRQAVQAIIDLANTDLVAALNAIPSFGDILTGGDEALVRAKISEMTQAAGDAVATGVDKLEAEFVSTITAIEKARAAAVAAGITDLARFDRAVQEAFDKLDEGMEERLDAPFPYDIAQLQRDLLDIDVPEFVDQFGALREGMRDAVKEGLREGIRTDNWGEALRGVLASAVTGALDDSLDRLADILTDIITGNNSAANGFFSAVGSVFGLGRASGGNTLPYKRHRVNESGQGEFLFMGKNPGQVLTAAQINGMVSAGRGNGSTTIDARMFIQGSVDAVTWPKVEAAMKSQARQIMANVPHAVNATLIDNRTHQRRI